MTRKAFILYAVANMIPDLAQPIVDFLMERPKTKDSRAVQEDIEADNKK
jgi:hypothetical protein